MERRYLGSGKHKLFQCYTPKLVMSVVFRSMFVKAQSGKEIDIVEHLASQIWREYFAPMFEADTLDYVIHEIQSKAAILRQVSDGYAYYLIQQKGDTVGYFAIHVSEQRDEIILSKLYLLSSERGKGLGKQVVGSLEEIAREQGISKITLSVFEKNTKALKAYEKMGFQRTSSLDRDIGNGIVLHDYVMEKICRITFRN